VGRRRQSQQLLASGEASLGQFWNGRVYALQQDGAPVGVSWKQNLVMADFLVIPKGAKNKDAAMKFLANASSAEGQAEFANKTAYAPVNVDSAPSSTRTSPGTCRPPTPRTRSPWTSPTGPRTARPSRPAGMSGWSNESRHQRPAQRARCPQRHRRATADAARPEPRWRGSRNLLPALLFLACSSSPR
jgi:hypothetical protein